MKENYGIYIKFVVLEDNYRRSYKNRKLRKKLFPLGKKELVNNGKGFLVGLWDSCNAWNASFNLSFLNKGTFS